MNVVLLERVIKGAGEGGVEDSGGQGECDDEESADGRDDGRSETTPAGEQCQETDKDLDDGGDEGNYECNEHPFGHGLVGIKPSFKLFAK